MSNKKNTISIVVPCHIRHLKHVKSIILGNVSKQTLRPDEVIVVTNPVNNSYQEQVISFIFDDINKDYDIVKNFNVKESCTPGKIRNIGFEYSSGDIVIFSDADDLYHPTRNETIARIFEDYECDIVLHDYFLKEKDFIFKKIGYESILVDNCVPSEISQTGNQPRNNDFGIAQGHASFKREVLKEIKYDEVLVPGEDGEILRRAYKENKKLICINAKLSSWFPSGAWRANKKITSGEAEHATGE